MQSVMTGGSGRGKPRGAPLRRPFRGFGARDHQVSGPQVSGARIAGVRIGSVESGDTGQALARLEAAVERLAIAASRMRTSDVPGEGVPRAQVQAIADRLDETIARLRSALGEDA
jgi:hypothetical protein